MALPREGCVRVKLSLRDFGIEEPRWMLINLKRTFKIQQLLKEIANLHFDSYSAKIQLNLHDAVLPPWESTAILQDNDFIDVLRVAERSDVESETLVTESDVTHDPDDRNLPHSLDDRWERKRRKKKRKLDEASDDIGQWRGTTKSQKLDEYVVLENGGSVVNGQDRVKSHKNSRSGDNEKLHRTEKSYGKCTGSVVGSKKHAVKQTWKIVSLEDHPLRESGKGDKEVQVSRKGKLSSRAVKRKRQEKSQDREREVLELSDNEGLLGDKIQVETTCQGVSQDINTVAVDYNGFDFPKEGHAEVGDESCSMDINTIISHSSPVIVGEITSCNALSNTDNIELNSNNENSKTVAKESTTELATNMVPDVDCSSVKVKRKRTRKRRSQRSFDESVDAVNTKKPVGLTYFIEQAKKSEPVSTCKDVHNLSVMSGADKKHNLSRSESYLKKLGKQKHIHFSDSDDNDVEVLDVNGGTNKEGKLIDGRGFVDDGGGDISSGTVDVTTHVESVDSKLVSDVTDTTSIVGEAFGSVDDLQVPEEKDREDGNEDEGTGEGGEYGDTGVRCLSLSALSSKYLGLTPRSVVHRENSRKKLVGATAANERSSEAGETEMIQSGLSAKEIVPSNGVESSVRLLSTDELVRYVARTRFTGEIGNDDYGTYEMPLDADVPITKTRDRRVSQKHTGEPYESETTTAAHAEHDAGLNKVSHAVGVSDGSEKPERISSLPSATINGSCVDESDSRAVTVANEAPHRGTTERVLSTGAKVYSRQRVARLVAPRKLRHPPRSQWSAEATPSVSNVTSANRYSHGVKLVGRPVIGSTIAYKICEIQADYSPAISDFKEGVVTDFDADTKKVTLHMKSVPVQENLLGKFDVVLTEGADVVLTNLEQPSSGEKVVSKSLHRRIASNADAI